MFYKLKTEQDENDKSKQKPNKPRRMLPKNFSVEPDARHHVFKICPGYNFDICPPPFYGAGFRVFRQPLGAGQGCNISLPHKVDNQKTGHHRKGKLAAEIVHYGHLSPAAKICTGKISPRFNSRRRKRPFLRFLTPALYVYTYRP